MADTFSAESRLIHAGTERTPGLPGTPPLAPASIYVSAGPPRLGRAYGRDGNPGWEALEQALGGLEDAEAVAFASGQAASMALMLALAPGRERIVLPNDGYYGGRVLADRLRPHGAVPVPVDLQDLAAVERELTAAPSVLWAETPTNPLLRVADLARLGALATAAGAPMVVDNTVATGLLQRPLEAGATASLYSLTKSVSGHSDVILGAVVSRDAELLAALRAWRSSGGGIPGPFEAWLALRGLKTLPLRIARQSHSALAVARHLAGHPRVTAVHYPGIDTSTIEVARRQMPDGFGPLLSFEVTPGNADAADTVVASSRLILPATSFGGVESTWERRARWPGETAPAGADPAVGRRRARRGPDRRPRPCPGGAVMRRAFGSYEIDDDPARIDPAAAVSFLTTEAYWGRWRGEQEIRQQIAAAWRVTGAYDSAGAMVGFARAFSDGGSAYLSDVYVLPAHRGAGLGRAIVAMMIEDGPGRRMALDAAHLGCARPVPVSSASPARNRQVPGASPRGVWGKARQAGARAPAPTGSRSPASTSGSNRCSTSTCPACWSRPPAAASSTAGPRCRRTRPRSAGTSRRRSRPGTRPGGAVRGGPDDRRRGDRLDPVLGPRLLAVAGRPASATGPDTCEIGHTWLSRDAIRTAANTEMKRLMLTHAFEVWQVRSVCLHTDARNQRSRDAMQRIGARFEGILRAHRLGADLNPRDSVRFSITAAEWPSVRLRLDELSRRYQPA